MTSKHARIIRHPFTASLQGSLLDSFDIKQHGDQLHVMLKIRALEQTSSRLFERDGQIYERIHANYVPIQLGFSRASELKASDLFTNITKLPPDDPARTIHDVLSWRQSGRDDVFYLFSMLAPQTDNLVFFADRVVYKRLSHEFTSITVERDWCPPPPMPDRLIPRPTSLHQRFGGDPITVYINSRPYHRRLFIGGLEIQANKRPHVDVVLNVGEKPSSWAMDARTHLQDRWDNKGEGSEGMSHEVILEEANWVIERLRKHQRILVHCVAGMNRSSTICSATLILLEGITAEQALARVREHHPWARPDSRHWLKLRWLAKQILD
jgi:hypothetical protein